MRLALMGIITATTLLFSAQNCKSEFNWKIETGSRGGTYYPMGEDLAQWVAPKACINLTPEVTHGSLENIWRLRKVPHVKLAIVQMDVMAYFQKLAENGNKIAQDIVNKLRVIKPLYIEEVHFITRKDSQFVRVQDIKEAKIEIGPKGSGTALTSKIIYRELFHQDLPSNQKFQDDLKTAIRNLQEGRVDVVIVVGGQPLSGLKLGEKGKGLKFLVYDSKHPLQVKNYEITYIKPTSYSWSRKRIPTLGVRSYLITFNYKSTATVGLGRLGFWLHQKLPILKREGHPKWREVNEELPPETQLPFGWKYYIYSKAGYQYQPGTPCNQILKRIGLCRKGE